MENTVIHKIRRKITRAKIGEVFFVSSFPKSRHSGPEAPSR